MRKLSFRKKVIFTFLAGMSLTVFVVLFMCEILVRPIFIWDSQKMMKKYAQQIEEQLDTKGENIESLLEEMNDSYRIRCTVLDKGDQLLYNVPATKDEENAIRLAKKKIQQYEEQYDENGVMSVLDDEENVKLLQFIKETSDGNHIVLIKTVKGIDQDVRLVSFFLLFVAVILAVLMTVVWSVLTKSFVQGIEKMSIATQKMANLDFSEKVSYKSEDEIGVLANSINRMSDELSRYIDTMEEEVERRKALVRNLSHELRTPITTIRGYAENTMILLPDHEKVQRYCGVMLEECDSITELSEYMLDMSRMERDGYVIEKEDLQTTGLQKELQTMCRHNYGEEQVEVQFQEATLQGKAILIKRALLNYIENAIKYGDGQRIRVVGKEETNRYYFTVHNTGRKIQEEEQKKIWDVFYKESKARTRDKCFGLGLAFAKQIALLHDGGVGVSSTEEETVFTIWIPME